MKTESGAGKKLELSFIPTMSRLWGGWGQLKGVIGMEGPAGFSN